MKDEPDILDKTITYLEKCLAHAQNARFKVEDRLDMLPERMQLKRISKIIYQCLECMNLLERYMKIKASQKMKLALAISQQQNKKKKP